MRCYVFSSAANLETHFITRARVTTCFEKSALTDNRRFGVARDDVGYEVYVLIVQNRSREDVCGVVPPDILGERAPFEHVRALERWATWAYAFLKDV